MLPLNIYADIYFEVRGLNCCQCFYLHLNIVFVSSKGLVCVQIGSSSSEPSLLDNGKLQNSSACHFPHVVSLVRCGT